MESWILIAVLFLAGAPMTAEDVVEARFRAEYPKAAAELDAIVRSFTAEGTFSQHYFNGETFTFRRFVLGAANDRRVVICDKKAYEPGPRKTNRDLRESVVCLTPEYTFELRRASEMGPYLILSFEPTTMNSPVVMDVNDYFSVSVECLTRFHGSTLLKRMQSPSFHLKSAESTVDGGVEVIRIDYTYTWADTRGSEDGSVWLEPARKWAIRRLDVLCTPNPHAPRPKGAPAGGKVGPPGRLQCEMEYQSSSGGIPFPKRSILTHRLLTDGAANPDRYQQERFELESVKLGDPPSEWFKLSGYGLPDLLLKPVRAKSYFSLTNPWLWGSLAVAIISFVLLWRLRRSRLAAN